MRVLLISIACLFIASNTATADQGIGVSFGYPGVSVTYRADNFPVIGLSYYLGSDSYVAATLDYWISRKDLAKKLDWYWGVGATIGVNAKKSAESDGILLGARVPLGLLFMPSKDWEIFGEVAPRLDVLPGTRFNINFTVGVRYVW